MYLNSVHSLTISSLTTFFPVVTYYLLLLITRKTCIGMEFAGYVYGRYLGLSMERILCLVFRD